MPHERRASVGAEESDPSQRQYSPQAGTRRTAASAALYYVLRLSDLAREGIDNSGSYRFADHIYVGRPAGRTPLGRWIDARLLGMPAARAFRCRYQKAREIVLRSLGELPNEGLAGSERTRPTQSSLRVLAIPCGIPRDILEVARTLRHEQPALLERLEYRGMDLDPQVLRLAGALLRDSGLGISTSLRKCTVG